MQELFLGLTNNWSKTDEEIYGTLIESLRGFPSFKETGNALSRHCYVKHFYVEKLHIYYYEDIEY